MVPGSGGCSVVGTLCGWDARVGSKSEDINERPLTQGFPPLPVQLGCDKGRYPLPLWSCCSARAQIKEGLFSKPIPG